MQNYLFNRNADYEAIVKRCASKNRLEAEQAQETFASMVGASMSVLPPEEGFSQADLNAPLRAGVLVGDIVRNIYIVYPLGANEQYVEYPLDILAPGEEDKFIAYTQPGTGRIAERHVEGDYVRVPTYRVQSSVDWDLKFMENVTYPVLSRVNEIYQAGFVKKMNDDGWSAIITAAADRNVMVYDADANAGQFTKRLISLAKIVVRRNGGGNSASLKRAKLTDVFGSPEMGENIRNWGIDQLDDYSRNAIYMASDGSSTLTRVFDVNIHEFDEFGVGQIYQTFYLEQLGASLQASDTELAIGLDLLNRDSFIMPIAQEVQTFTDMTQHRARRMGIYGWANYGFGVLDTRRVVALSF